MSVVAQNLFSSSQSAPKSKHLVEFKAGKMHRENTMVRPDLRKGLVYLTQSDDGLLHFCWKDRSNGKVEDDLIVFPEEAEWIRVQQCTTGRVFVLKFKTSSQRYFFWLQDASDKNDEQIKQKMQEYLKAPPAPGSNQNQMQTDVDEQQQLMQLLQSQGLLEPMREEGTAASGTSLASVITPELVSPILHDQNLCAKLFPHLPANHERTAEEISSLIRSPQFAEALQSLDNAIQSGQHGPLLAELGIDVSAALSSNDRVLALLRAIKDKKQRSSGNQ